MTTTEEIVASMLVENTGSHMLDSGGAYGRNHERNRGKTVEDFKAEPAIKLYFDIRIGTDREGQPYRYPECDATMSVFHFLVETCDYDEGMDDLFHKVFETWGMATQGETTWFTMCYEFGDWLQNFNFRGECIITEGMSEEVTDDCTMHDHTNPFDNLVVVEPDWRNSDPQDEAQKAIEGWNEWVEKYGDSALYDYVIDNARDEKDGLYGFETTVNTYNNEDALSQVIQYTTLGHGGSAYALVSVHGGCDVRGGYTKPRVFSLSEDTSTIFDNARFVLAAWDEENGRQYGWYTDNAGYSFYPQDDENDFNKMEFLTVEEAVTQEHDPDNTVVVNTETHEGFYKGLKLEAWFY